MELKKRKMISKKGKKGKKGSKNCAISLKIIFAFVLFSAVQKSSVDQKETSRKII